MPYAPAIPDEVTTDEIRSLLEGAGEYLLNIQTDGDRESDSYETDVRSAVDFINNYDAILLAFERSRDDTRAPHVNFSGGGSGPTAATQQVTNAHDLRSIGHRVVAEELYTAWVRRSGEARDFPNIEVDGVSFHRPEMRALLDHVGASGADVWSPQGQPVLPPGAAGVRQRRLFVRDIMSVVQTTLQSVPYIRELNPVTNETGATTVAEGATKPMVDMQFAQEDAPIRKIAAWIPATTEIFQDAPLLRGYVDTRLNYMLALTEENQILNGNGTAPNLRGIMNTVGIQTQAVVALPAGSTGISDIPSVTGQAIGKIENVDGDADAVVMNPIDFWMAVTARVAQNQDNPWGGLGGAPNTVLSLTWGLPTIRTRAIASGSLLVGAFGMGATLLDRQRVNIRSSDSHDTFFITNKIAVVAEERVGLAVHRPDFFVLATGLDVTP
jgi:hypothetical protein